MREAQTRYSNPPVLDMVPCRPTKMNQMIQNQHKENFAQYDLIEALNVNAKELAGNHQIIGHDDNRKKTHATMPRNVRVTSYGNHAYSWPTCLRDKLVCLNHGHPVRCGLEHLFFLNPDSRTNGL